MALWKQIQQRLHGCRHQKAGTDSLNLTSSPVDLRIRTNMEKSYNHHMLILYVTVLNTGVQLEHMSKMRHLPWLVGAEGSNHYTGETKNVHAGSQPTHHFNNKVIKPKVMPDWWFPKYRPIKVSQQVGIEHCKSRQKKVLAPCVIVPFVLQSVCSSPCSTLKGLLMALHVEEGQTEEFMKIKSPIIWDRFTIKSSSSSKIVLGCDFWLLKLEDKCAYKWFSGS